MKCINQECSWITTRNECGWGNGNDDTCDSRIIPDDIKYPCHPKVRQALEECGYVEIDGEWHGRGGRWDWWELTYSCIIDVGEN